MSGECVPVGCNKVLQESSVRDRCGVWCGNGTTCVPVRDTYTVPTEVHTTGKLLYIFQRYYTVLDCMHFTGSLIILYISILICGLKLIFLLQATNYSSSATDKSIL